ncbi:MAG: hypothetical protein OHK0039_40990 [Bacteroidia bacterium]
MAFGVHADALVCVFASLYVQAFLDSTAKGYRSETEPLTLENRPLFRSAYTDSYE